MKRPSVTLAVACAIAACALAGTAASAFAVTIEPLSTNFEGKNIEFVRWINGGSEDEWGCTKAAFTGKTAATKTNLLEFTDAFSGCETAIGSSKFPIVYSNECGKFKGVPWVVTLNAGGTASLTTNCTLVSNWGKSECIIKAAPQTITTGIFWESEANKLWLRFASAPFKSLTLEKICAAIGLQATTEKLSTEIEISGIHAS